jgi:signal transduction histidine kinase
VSLPKLLLVEDNPGDARLLRELLREGFELAHVERLEEAIARARSADLVLLDLSLPDSHGLDTFRRLHAAVPQVPVLVLTGLADDDGAVSAVREGAQDWLVKGTVDEDSLRRAVRYALERHRLTARLVELDRVRSLFLSVVSHDLKSPAAAILAGIDLLLGERLGPLEPRQRRVLELARQSARRQIRLVADLLDAAAIEAGSLALRPADVALGPLVEETLDELGPLLAEKRLEVTSALAEVTVRGDRDRLAQVIANLLTNAAKFARTSVTLTLTAGPDSAELVVEDDGPGLQAEIVPSLFERFVCGDGPSSGSGLGLSIVRGVAEAHGGTARATNRPEGGARFVVTLPRSGSVP